MLKRGKKDIGNCCCCFSKETGVKIMAGLTIVSAVWVMVMAVVSMGVMEQKLGPESLPTLVACVICLVVGAFPHAGLIFSGVHLVRIAEQPDWMSVIVVCAVCLFMGSVPCLGVWKRNNLCLLMWVVAFSLTAAFFVVSVFAGLAILISGKVPGLIDEKWKDPNAAWIEPLVSVLCAFLGAFEAYAGYVVNTWRKAIQ